MEPTLVIALKAVSAVKHGLDQATLRDQLGTIERRLDAVGAHLAEDVVSKLRAGFAHLGAAQSVRSPTMRAEEYAAARRIFAEFSERQGGDELLVEFRQMAWRHVSALGHLGNYYYFLLNGEERLALQHAYSAVERYPMMALDVLPRQLIPESVRSLVPPGVGDPEKLRVGLVQAQANHREVRRRYRMDMAWRVPAAAAYVVAGLAGSVIAPNMAAMGARGAMGLLVTSEEGLLPPRLGMKAYLAEIQIAEGLLTPISEEAARRRQQLERQLGHGS
jgi:hypothetical protein